MHDGVLGERAEQTHQPEVLAVQGVVAGGAVADLEAGWERSRVVAQVGVAGDAHDAAPAGGHEPEHDVVAGLEPAHTLADLDDDPGTLVAADHGRSGGGAGEVARDDVLVAMTHAGRLELDQHLACLGWVELDVLDALRRVEFVQDGGASSHGSPPLDVARVSDADCSHDRSAACQRGSTATWMY